MKLSNKQLLQRLRRIHILSDDNLPITFPAFKNRAMVQRYSGGNKAVFIGVPSKNIFGFYVKGKNDLDLVKEAYKMYIRLVKNQMDEFESGLIKWSTDIPDTYEGK